MPIYVTCLYYKSKVKTLLTRPREHSHAEVRYWHTAELDFQVRSVTTSENKISRSVACFDASLPSSGA